MPNRKPDTSNANVARVLRLTATIAEREQPALPSPKMFGDSLRALADALEALPANHAPDCNSRLFNGPLGACSCALPTPTGRERTVAFLRECAAGTESAQLDEQLAARILDAMGLPELALPVVTWEERVERAITGANGADYYRATCFIPEGEVEHGLFAAALRAAFPEMAP